MTLQRLVYRSSATGENSKQDLDLIVARSILKNRKLGITGVVALCESRFVQVLEGQAKQLDLLMASIEKDARHKGLRVLGRWTVSGRLFPSWSMVKADAVGGDNRISDILQFDDHGVSIIGALLTITAGLPLNL